MTSTYGIFKVSILVMLFYGFSITLISHLLPDGAKQQANIFITSDNDISNDAIINELESGITRQRDVPIIDLGALVFYSGNFLIDLVLNFLFAVPQMITFFFVGLGTIINIDAFIFQQLQTILSVLVGTFYIIGLVEIILNLRAGGQVLT